MRRSFLVFGAPRVEDDEIREVVLAIKSGWMSTGPRVMQFQEDFKKYMHVPYAQAVNSCTAGLFLSLKALGIGPGDEVITCPLTFAATANVIIHCGAKPVFVDAERETMNINPALIQKKITKKTKAIIPVHFAGRPCDMDAIMKIARKNKLYVIQDAAHALETRYHGKRIGEIGDLTAFSFYATKNLTTGDGGMVTTQREDWARKVQVLSAQGMTRGAWTRYSAKGFKQYQIVEAGFKFNMMDMQAALGIRQLEKIEKYLKIREQVWKAYDKGLQNLPLTAPAVSASNTRHARHLYTPLINLEALKISREEFQEELFKMKIGTGVHFISLHLHPYYQKTYGYKPSDFPESAYISGRTISLPLSAKLTLKDVDDVVWAIKKIVKQHKR